MGCEVSKVSEEGFQFDETAISAFCGREKEINEISSLITNKKVKTSCVYGPKSIGKTRVINRVLTNEKLSECFKQISHIDCSLFEQDCVDNYFIPFLREFYESIDLEKKLELCGTCELCKQKAGCRKLLKEMSLTLKEVKLPTLISFDNADNLLNSSFKPWFLDFIKTTTEMRPNIKLLVTSTVRVHLTSKATKTYLVDKMEKDDLKKLIVQILTPDEDEDSAVDYLSNLRVKDPWLEAVAILCDGMPKCAELLGTILREDDFLFEPIELVQLLLTNFIETLNPDLFAKSDRPSAQYQEELGKFKEISEAYQERWLYDMAETTFMVDGKITPEEAHKAVRDAGSQVTMGTFKMDGIRKMLDNSILQKNSGPALSMQRLYQHLIALVDDKEYDGLNTKTYISKQSVALIKEDAKKIDLFLDGNLDALKIEKVLYRRQQKMTRGDSGMSSGEEHDEDSGNDSNDSNEHELENIMNKEEEIDDHYRTSGYNGYDSTSGPYAMSFRSNDIHTHNVNGIVDDVARVDIGEYLPNALPHGDQNETNDQNNQHTDLGLEGNYFTEIMNGNVNIHEATDENILSNTYPTFALRRDFQQMKTEETNLKQKRNGSTNQIYVTPVHRLSSEEYEQSIGNNCVTTAEARNINDDRESPTKGEKRETYTRYSGSSTDSGELKLGFETKTFACEK